MQDISGILRRRGTTGRLARAAFLALVPALPATAVFAQQPVRSSAPRVAKNTAAAATAALRQQTELPPLAAPVSPPPNPSERLPSATPEPQYSPQGLSLAALQSLAVANNPALGQAWGAVVAAEGKYIQAGLQNNPNVGYNGQQLGSNGTEQHGVMVSQEIIRHKKLSTQQQAACHEVTAARQRFEAQRLRVVTDVRTAYFETLTAYEMTALNQRLIEIADQTQGVAKKRFEAKEASRIDLLQAKIEADQVRLSLARAKNRLDAAWRQLAAVVGVPLAPQPLDGPLPPEPPRIGWDDAWRRVQGQSPELAAAEADVQRARWQVQRELVETAPNLSVQAIVQYDRDIQNWDGGLQATIPIPILNQNQGNIRKAQGELQTAEQNVQRIGRDLEHRLAEVYQRYADAAAEVDRYTNEIMPAARETLTLVGRGYQEGEFPFDHVLAAQRTYFTARLNQLESQQKLHTAAAQIEGLLLTGSLQER